MLFKRHIAKLAILFIVLGGLTAFLNATYYEPDFFPIGLTGINYTGDWNCPYEEAKIPNWTWDDPDQDNEKALIFSLGVNCLGSEDAWSLTRPIKRLTFIYNFLKGDVR